MIGRISEKVGGSGIFLLSISTIYVTLGIIDIQVVRNTLWVLVGLILVGGQFGENMEGALRERGLKYYEMAGSVRGGLARVIERTGREDVRG